MDKKTPIRISIKLTILEAGIFIALCGVQASVMNQARELVFLQRFVINLLSGYLALIGGIATTWYVVFTYYMMQSTIEFNKQMSKPFANLSWEVINEEPGLKAEILLGSGKREPDTNNTQAKIAESKWVTLVIMNARNNLIDEVSFKIRIEGGSETVDVKPFELSYKGQKLRIEKDKCIRIGIIDLLRYQSNVLLKIDLFEFSYKANDSTDIQIDHNDVGGYSAYGLGMIVPGRSIAESKSVGGES